MTGPFGARELLGGCRSLALDGLGGLALDALGDTGRLSATIAQIIELGAAHEAAADDLDGIDVGRIDREHALHAFAVRDLADREALLEAGAGAGDADALIGLHAAALAFLDLHVDDDGIAGLKVRNGLAELLDVLFVELLDDIHCLCSCRRKASRESDASQ